MDWKRKNYLIKRVEYNLGEEFPKPQEFICLRNNFLRQWDI